MNNVVLNVEITFYFSVESLPIHCIIEHDYCAQENESPPGEPVDSYAILPGTTLFSEVVHNALLKIGYTATEAIGAKGEFLSFDIFLIQRSSSIISIFK